MDDHLPDIVRCILTGCIQISIPVQDPKLAEVFAEIFSAQVKSLSFIVYFVRGLTSSFSRESFEDIVRSTLSLLRQCPPDFWESRRV